MKQILAAKQQHAVSGIVSWYNDAKGYGFISTELDSQVFVHYSAIEGNGFKTLAEGQRVEFTLIESKYGLQAAHVKKMT